MNTNAKQVPRPFDVILLWEFSRFARNQEEATFYKSMLRKKYGIDILSVKEPIPQGIYGRLIETIIEWQDEFYSVNLSAEVTRSMKLKALQGLYNSKMPLGYDKAPNAFPTINPQEASVVQSIFSLFISGHGKSEIARLINAQGYQTKNHHSFSAQAVGYILENPFYIGKIRWNRRKSSATSRYKAIEEWIVSDAHHTAIIDSDTWNAAQKLISSHPSAPATAHTPVQRHWLTGLIHCSVCGRALYYKSGCKSNGYCNGFQCSGYSHGFHPVSQFISTKKLTAFLLRELAHPSDTSAAVFLYPRLIEIIKSNAPDSCKKEAVQNLFEGIIFHKETKSIEFLYHSSLPF
jgi:DNA invertase Pin-like site-specific DNA recombinase